jgi:hypothetical protein
MQTIRSLSRVRPGGAALREGAAHWRVPLSEFEAFRRELIDAGANEVEDTYNSPTAPAGQ